jgi:hypothetical protein
MENIQALLESSKYTPLSATDTAAMKMMLENTEKEHARLVNEGTLSGDVAQFTPILMPMVRRVYPNLIANEILGVQPMAMPTGFIYALTNQYTGSGEVKANPNTSAQVLDFTYTQGAGDATELNITDVITGNVTGAVGEVIYIEGSKALVIVTSGAFAVTDTAAVVVTVATDTEGQTIAVDGTYSNEAAFGRILSGYTGTYSTAAAEQLGQDMREIGFSISRKNVTANSRALKGQYTVEMYQDLKAQHGLLADEEIMSLMSYEMQAEIDREVVNFVNANATQLADTAFVTGTDAATAAVAQQSGRWEIEKYRVQSIRISTEAAQIGLDTKRGQGNILLVSPKVATMLEQVGSFKTADQASSVKAPISGGVAGTFDNRYKVIIDQYAVSDYCTVLYKGADRRDAMGFFAPYVPMSFTKVTSFDSGQPAVIAKTRYALDTIPGVATADSTDRAATYARSFGVNFANTILASA